MAETRREAEVRQVTWGWWLLVLVGSLSLVTGLILLIKPGDSLAALAVIAGIFLLIDGILEFASAFLRSTPDRGMVALFGAITAVVGVLLIRHPISGVTAIALLVGLWLIVIGVIRLATAFDDRDHRDWYAFAGVLELIAGIVIVANPDIGYATLAILLGIGFIINGVGLTALGWSLQGARGAVTPAPPRDEALR